MKKLSFFLTAILSGLAVGCPDVPISLKVGDDNFGGVRIEVSAKKVALWSEGGAIHNFSWDTNSNAQWMILPTNGGAEVSRPWSDNTPTTIKGTAGQATILSPQQKKLTVFANGDLVGRQSRTDAALRDRLEISYSFKVTPELPGFTSNKLEDLIATLEKQGKTKEEIGGYQMTHQLTVAYILRGDIKEKGSLLAEKVETPFKVLKAAGETLSVDLKGNVYRTKKAENGCHTEVELVK
jgi:hypothetical protein